VLAKLAHHAQDCLWNVAQWMSRGAPAGSSDKGKPIPVTESIKPY
jgi:hypothetical protein